MTNEDGWLIVGAALGAVVLWRLSRNRSAAPVEGGVNPVCAPASYPQSPSEALLCHVTGPATCPVAVAPLPSTVNESATAGPTPVNPVQTVQVANATHTPPLGPIRVSPGSPSGPIRYMPMQPAPVPVQADPNPVRSVTIVEGPISPEPLIQPYCGIVASARTRALTNY